MIGRFRLRPCRSCCCVPLAAHDLQIKKGYRSFPSRPKRNTAQFTQKNSKYAMVFDLKSCTGFVCLPIFKGIFQRELKSAMSIPFIVGNLHLFACLLIPHSLELCFWNILYIFYRGRCSICTLYFLPRVPPPDFE